jgi:hypothetical protein
MGSLRIVIISFRVCIETSPSELGTSGKELCDLYVLRPKAVWLKAKNSSTDVHRKPGILHEPLRNIAGSASKMAGLLGNSDALRLHAVETLCS